LHPGWHSQRRLRKEIEPGPAQPPQPPKRRRSGAEMEPAMVWTFILTQGLLYFLIVDGYLFFLMISLSPRIWGYSDYSDAIKKKVPPQTPREKWIAAVVGIPWLLFAFGFPVFSSFRLKGLLGAEFNFGTAFLNILVMVFLANIGDVIILDWLIVNTITPGFVVIPGTEKEDYKDFSHHYKGHIKAACIQLALCAILAAIVSL
jgi:hypothetical protein